MYQIGAQKFHRGGIERCPVVVVEPGNLRGHFVDHPHDRCQIVVDQVLDDVATNEAAA